MQATATYVAHLSHELAEMAEVAGLAFLTYLLKMAEAEARATVGDDAPNDAQQRASAFENRPQAG